MTENFLFFTYEGLTLKAIKGQSVASALIAEGKRITRTTRSASSLRGVFCGIGACFDCLVIIDGNPNQRACITEVRDGMVIQIQQGTQ